MVIMVILATVAFRYGVSLSALLPTLTPPPPPLPADLIGPVQALPAASTNDVNDLMCVFCLTDFEAI